MKLRVKLTAAVMRISRDDEITGLPIMFRTIQAHPCTGIAFRFLQCHDDGVTVRVKKPVISTNQSLYRDGLWSREGWVVWGARLALDFTVSRKPVHTVARTQEFATNRRTLLRSRAITSISLTASLHPNFQATILHSLNCPYL